MTEGNILGEDKKNTLIIIFIVRVCKKRIKEIVWILTKYE